MGTWNVSSFANDDAQDWVALLVQAEDTALIEATLSHVVENEDYVEAPEAQQAVAAAETVAAMRKRPARDTPDAIATWVRQQSPPSPDLVRLARRAVVHIQANSELSELWAEDNPLDWSAAMADLAERL